MQRFYVVKEVLNDKLKRGYEFTVENGYLEQKVDDKLREVAANVRMDGFRKGKVSLDLVRRNCGEDVIREVLSEVIDDASSQFMKEGGFGDVVTSEVRVTSHPKVCSEEGRGEDLVYELRFELMPEIPLVNPEDIALKEVEAEIAQADVESFIDELKTRYPNFVASGDPERCAAVGDRVSIDYRSSFMGKELRGGSADGFVMILGRNSLPAELESEVAGMKVGDTKKFELEFPKDYRVRSFAGKKVEMFVRLVNIMVPESVNDHEELAKNCGFKCAEDMMNFARESLKGRFAHMSDAIMRKELFDHMEANYQVQAPEFVVSQESARIRRELGSSDLESMGEDGVLKEAERRVKLGMLLMKVSRDRDIVVEAQDVVSFIQSNYLSYGVSLDAVLKLFRSNRGIRDQIRGKVLEDKVVRYMVAKAKKDRQNVPAGDLKSLFESI
ncbi:trigger factor [Anaplasma capra]|uniref:trigger factor n=1 Tax=Anaplasma capra TaxID=1562740 RepID=UPI0021D5A11B|nr:trigger factor [Anaplasma capra]MCU7611365.1 trigger factor [Anaplasma capra]MCU7612439.1 trigger factor [Anaplasma capra]